MDAGQLEVLPWTDMLVRGHRFDQDAMLASVEELIQSRASAGALADDSNKSDSRKRRSRSKGPAANCSDSRTGTRCFSMRARIKNLNRPLKRSLARGPAAGHPRLSRLRWRAVDSSGKSLGVTGTNRYCVCQGRTHRSSRSTIATAYIGSEDRSAPQRMSGAGGFQWRC